MPPELVAACRQLRGGIVDHDNPRTMKEALAGPFADLFSKAYATEHQQLRDMNVYERVRKEDVEPGAQVMKSGMVSKIKRLPGGEFEKAKGRFVAKGYSQRYGVDYECTFSPTPKMSSLRIVITLALEEKSGMWKFDVSGAFLIGDMELSGITNPMYIQLPDSEGGDVYVGRLLKSLYGTKQAGRVWWLTLLAELQLEGLVPTVNEPCLYQRTEHDGAVTRILVWVDDFFCTGREGDIFGIIGSMVHRTGWDIRFEGDGSWFIGMKIEYNPVEGWACMDMFDFLRALLEKHGYTDIPVQDTPARNNLVLPKFGAEEARLDHEVRAQHASSTCRKFPYATILGSLQWLCNTMPEIQQAVSAAGKHREYYGKVHVNALLRILGYCRGVMDRKERVMLWASGDGVPVLEAFSDADHASEWRTSGSSTSGVVVALNRGTVVTACKKQTGVADSTMEAESTAAGLGYKELVSVRNLLGETGYPQERATPLYVDNEAAIKAAANPLHHSRAKHIALKLWLLRKAVSDGEIDMIYVKTTLQLADIFTKALAREVFQRLQRRLYGLEAWGLPWVAMEKLKVTTIVG
jgi:hypothetical protein